MSIKKQEDAVSSSTKKRSFINADKKQEDARTGKNEHPL